MTKYNRDNYIQTDSPIKKELLKLFNKKERLTIFDIGGCEGEESIRYSKLFPFSNIYIFEPLPLNQELILKNISKYQAINVKLVPNAVSDKDEMSEFYVSSGHPENMQNDENWNFGNKSSSLLKPDENNMIEWLKFKQKIKVQSIRLKNFLKETKINVVDFVHMDVQGAELKVLKGAKEYLGQIKAIWLEVSEIELYKKQPLRLDIEVFMERKGFFLLKSEFNNKFGDQLYVNKKYFKIITILNKFRIIKKVKS